MDTYQCFLSAHGPRQLEFKVEYPLDKSGRRKTHYHLDVFFFTPYQLSVNPEQVSREEFLSNLSSTTRYKSFSLPLSGLLLEDSATSPLMRVIRVLRQGKINDAAEKSYVLYELRMLANVIQGQIKGERKALVEMIMAEPLRPDIICTMVTTLLDQLTQISSLLREQEPLVASPTIPAEVKQGYAWCDELISLRIEKLCLHIIDHLCDLSSVHPSLAEITLRSQEEAVRQVTYRREHGYESFIDSTRCSDRDAERFLFREHQLKKWAESAMYMTMIKSRAPHRVGHLFFGIAAAVAMGFAVGASLLAAEIYPANSINFALLAVLVYIFKDRLKEELRSLFKGWLPRMVADRIQYLVDPRNGQRIGDSRERLFFPLAVEIPPEVLRIRCGRSDPFRDQVPPESILHYQKDVVIHTRRMMSNHLRLSAINKVVRLDMRRWFYRMDEPEARLTWYEGMEEKMVLANRVYHIGVVVRLARDQRDDRPSLFRYRIIATREKILRIEEVDVSRL